MGIKRADVLNPWLSMWTRPRQTIQQIVDNDPTQHVIWLAALVGAISSTLPEVFRETATGSQWQVLLLVRLVLGGIAGVGWLYLWGALIQWMGRGFDGRAGREQVRAAIAWSGLPIVAAGFLIILLLFMHWLARMIGATWNPELLTTGLSVIHWGASFYWIVLFYEALAQVQVFSVSKALANTALAAFMLGAFTNLIGILMSALVDFSVIAGWLPI